MTCTCVLFCAWVCAGLKPFAAVPSTHPCFVTPGRYYCQRPIALRLAAVRGAFVSIRRVLWTERLDFEVFDGGTIGM